MESIKPVRMIDLAAFGGEGEIEMRAPNMRKQNEFKNTISKYVKVNRNMESVEMKDELPMGDLEIAMAMSYTWKAPFGTTITGFLNYCDELDENGGDSLALFQAMQKAIAEIDADSPFAGSQSAGTESSA